MSEFTKIGYEINLGGVWTDVTDDVLASPAPHCTRGIQGNLLDDRVADPGEFTFSLNNSSTNTAGIEGYWTPGNASGPQFWSTSIPVRIYFEFDGWHYIKWHGRIDYDGIKVIPGTKGARRVDVRAIDWMATAADHRIDLLKAQRNKYVYEAIDIVLGNMPLQPNNMVYYNERGNSGFSPLPVVFDVSSTDTTALGELQKFAMSQYMLIALRGGNYGETLTTSTEASMTGLATGVLSASSGKALLETSDRILLEDGSFLLLDEVTSCSFIDTDIVDMDVTFGKQMINHLTSVITPRKMDALATTILWTLERATDIAAGESVTMRGTWRDPAGGASKVNYDTDNPVTPVINTDYKANALEDGTGTDMTSSLGVEVSFGAAEAEIKLTNNHATTTLYVGGSTAGAFFQLRGRGTYVYDTVRLVIQSTDSIRSRGLHPFVYDYHYQTSPHNNASGTYGPTWSLGLLAIHKLPVLNIDKLTFFANSSDRLMSYFIFMEPLQKIFVTESVSGFSATSFFVMGYEFEIMGKSVVRMTLTLKRGTLY